MSNTLENFIREHRNELDIHTPSAAVWSSIEAGINSPTFIKSKISWLKYAGFSASIIAVLVYLKINTSNPGVTAKNAASAKTELACTVTPITSAETEAKSIPAIAAPDEHVTENKLAEQPTIAPPSAAVANESVKSNLPILKQSSESEPAPIVNQTYTRKEKLDSEPFQQETSSGFWSCKDSLIIDTTFSGVKTIEVNCSNFDINILAVTGDKISFRANSKSEIRGRIFRKRSCIIKYERNDTILKIIEENESKRQSGTEVQELVTLNFKVPSSTNVVIHSSSGDVKIEGLQSKLCNINLHSGDLKLVNLSTELKLSLSSGDISANDIKGNVSAKLTSGDVSFSNVNGNINIETNSGDQRYENITGNIKTKCSSGDFKITGMNGDATIYSNSGDITLKDVKGNPMLHTSSGDIEGKAIELTEKMEVYTNTGDIQMQLVNDLNNLSFDAETGFGNITIDKNGEKMSGEKHLILKKGNILIKAHTSSGDQSYR